MFFSTYNIKLIVLSKYIPPDFSVHNYCFSSRDMSQYGSVEKQSSSLPVWTAARPGILEPLRLPSPPPPANRFTTDPSVECIFCPRVFCHPEEHQDFLKHLLTCHKFVIGDVNLIANFPAYVSYWRNKFKANSPSKYCTTMRAAVITGLPYN